MMEPDTRARMVALAESFPTLNGLLEVLDPDRLDRWACGPAPSTGGLRGVQFVLGVWNDRADWKCGKFDFHAAYTTWNADHRAAFLAWAQAPW